MFSRRFVDTIPLSAGGFGIETDMTLNALSKRMHIIELPIHYGSRPEGSESKLNTWRDGVIILSAIVRLFKRLAARNKWRRRSAMGESVAWSI